MGWYVFYIIYELPKLLLDLNVASVTIYGAPLYIPVPWRGYKACMHAAGDRHSRIYHILSHLFH